jgi:nicotinamide riboside kinase
MEENLKQQKADVIKIAMFGPESTGKTTLSIQLADYYKTEWVPEFARDYLQKKWDDNQGICNVNDMMPIAYGQTKLENEKLAKANKYLFCDTNLMVTKVFSEVYYDYCDPLLDEAAKQHQYDLFFLTDIDVPWEKDDLRDGPENRKSVFAVFKDSLIKNNKPFITLSGDQESRLKKAVVIIDTLAAAKEIGFTTQDFVQIYHHGIPFENIVEQLGFFKKGIPKAKLVKPASLTDGILKLSEQDFKNKAAYFDDHKSKFALEKFVPASGAASRMFKFLNVFLNEFKIDEETINSYINRRKDNDLSTFIGGIDRMPFFKEVYEKLSSNVENFEDLDLDHKNYHFICFILSPNYFNYANKPKGILPFHKYAERIASPIEEHMYECAYYASVNNKSLLHFTVSQEHQSQFEDIVKSVEQKVKKETNTAVNVSYSFQNKKTDTIAVTFSNETFYDDKGYLVFRPGGHGALIENLDKLNSDVVFIKNIDNVIQNDEVIAIYKKALAGILIETQQQVFSYLEAIEDGELTEDVTATIVAFLQDKLSVVIDDNFSSCSLEAKTSYINSKLNRPIRVCGVVKNEGEPGGGPFWVQDDKGDISLQIVESSQVNMNVEDQVTIMATASHFNPVDLVCGIRNFKGEKFDLNRYVDKNSGFIVEKNTAGTTVKSYELPGLWNGAMANWITLFVEIPLLTFNPVKTVNDLLKAPHQPSIT